MTRFRPQQYLAPTSVSELMMILAADGEAARPIAGGTLLHELGKRGMISKVKKLVDLRGLGLDYVKSEEDRFIVGSMTTLTRLLRSGVCDWLGMGALRDLLSRFTPLQIRNMATVGGEVCAAVPFLDLPPVLISLDAALNIQGPKGNRVVPIENFYVDYFLSDISFDEILLEVQIPRFKGKVGSAFMNIKRNAVDLALLNASAKLELDSKGDRCVSARVAVGGINRTVVRATKVEGQLNGVRVDYATAMKAAAALAVAKPISSIHASSDYKKSILPVLLADCILKAYERAATAGE